uniref:Cytochrome c oxidase subunit 3 n=1 Tax=Cavenderia fasciculata TaxID=261658 RepID=B2XX67_CACFS|nr:cytochrome oxidase subunit 3 [Cavenderia fasciculata]ABX45189.1 cytochrome oxidase subunit 3 [Cavenderia fasciculata]
MESLNRILKGLENILNSRGGESYAWEYPYGKNYEMVTLANVYNPTHIKRHPYHIVKSTMAPILTAVPLGFFVLHYFGVMKGIISVQGAVIAFIGGLVLWGISITYDSIIDQQHTFEVRRGLVIGMLLFIASEVMFFFSFFWSFFFISLSPTIAIGCVWPPYGLHVYNHLGLPLLNTVILLLSGAILTDGYAVLTERKIAHEGQNSAYKKMMICFEAYENMVQKYEDGINNGRATNFLQNVKENGLSQKFIEELKDTAEVAQTSTETGKNLGVLKGKLIMWELNINVMSLKEEVKNEAQGDIEISRDLWVAAHQVVRVFLDYRNTLILNRLKLTLVCAVLFLYCQSIEYINAPFSLNDGIYGSLFFLLTGFHGFHVFIGSLLISIITFRFLIGNFGLLHVGTKFEIFKSRSTGFACTLFYWHFVDVVWLFLYLVIYWWSSNI